MAPQEGKKLAHMFGAIVAEKRRQLGLSQEILAEQLGISQESLSRMEKGVIAPRFERLQAFAQALHCPVADLFRENTAHERAASLEHILSPLPDRLQEELVDIMVKMAVLLKK